MIGIGDSRRGLGWRWWTVKPEFIPMFGEGRMLFFGQRFAKEQTIDEVKAMGIIVWIKRFLHGGRIWLGRGG